MVFIIFGKPLVLWLGLLTLSSLIFQIYLGYRLTHGRSDLFKYHRMNVIVLSILVLIHLTLGILLYF